MKWVPTKADTYKITASFIGSESYYSSWAEAGIVVDAASQATNSNQQIIPADNTPILYSIAGATIAIIIAVAVVGLLLYRKRP